MRSSLGGLWVRSRVDEISSGVLHGRRKSEEYKDGPLWSRSPSEGSEHVAHRCLLCKSGHAGLLPQSTWSSKGDGLKANHKVLIEVTGNHTVLCLEI